MGPLAAASVKETPAHSPSCSRLTVNGDFPGVEGQGPPYMGCVPFQPAMLTSSAHFSYCCRAVRPKVPKIHPLSGAPHEWPCHSDVTPTSHPAFTLDHRAPERLHKSTGITRKTSQSPVQIQVRFMRLEPGPLAVCASKPSPLGMTLRHGQSSQARSRKASP